MGKTKDRTETSLSSGSRSVSTGSGSSSAEGSSSSRGGTGTDSSRSKTSKSRGSSTPPSSSSSSSASGSGSVSKSSASRSSKASSKRGSGSSGSDASRQKTAVDVDFDDSTSAGRQGNTSSGRTNASSASSSSSASSNSSSSRTGTDTATPSQSGTASASASKTTGSSATGTQSRSGTGTSTSASASASASTKTGTATGTGSGTGTHSKSGSNKQTKTVDFDATTTHDVTEHDTSTHTATGTASSSRTGTTSQTTSSRTGTGSSTAPGSGSGSRTHTTSASASRSRTTTGAATTTGTGTGTGTESSTGTGTTSSSGSEGSSRRSGNTTGTTSTGTTSSSGTATTSSSSGSETESDSDSSSSSSEGTTSRPSRPSRTGTTGMTTGTGTTSVTTSRTNKGTSSSSSSSSSGTSSASSSSSSSSASSTSSSSSDDGTSAQPGTVSKDAPRVSIVAGPPEGAETTVKDEAPAKARKVTAGEGDTALSSTSKHDADTETVHADEAMPLPGASTGDATQKDHTDTASTAKPVPTGAHVKSRYAAEDEDGGEGADRPVSTVGGTDGGGRPRRSTVVNETDTDIRPIRDKIAGGMPVGEASGRDAASPPQSAPGSAPVSPIPHEHVGEMTETPRELLARHDETSKLPPPSARSSSSATTEPASSSTASEASYVASVRERPPADTSMTLKPGLDSFTAGGTVVMSKAPAISMSNDPQMMRRSLVSPTRSVDGSHGGTPWMNAMNASQVAGTGTWMEEPPKVRDVSLLSGRWWADFAAMQQALTEFPQVMNPTPPSGPGRGSSPTAAPTQGGYYVVGLDVAGLRPTDSSVLQLRLAVEERRGPGQGHGQKMRPFGVAHVALAQSVARGDNRFAFALPSPSGKDARQVCYLVLVHADPADPEGEGGWCSLPSQRDSGEVLGEVRGWACAPLPALEGGEEARLDIDLVKGSPDILRVAPWATVKPALNRTGTKVGGSVKYVADGGVAARLHPLHVHRLSDPPPGLVPSNGAFATDTQTAMYTWEGFSVAFPRDGLQVVGQRLADHFGVASVTVKHLAVEVFAHDTARCIAPAALHRLDFVEPRPTPAQPAAAATTDHYATAARKAWRLPVHPRCGIVYQLAVELEKAPVERVVLGWHVQLPFAAGKQTVDTVRGSVVKVRALKGPFVTCNGVAVVDKVPGHGVKAVGGAPGQASAVMFEFAAWVSETPETRREVERRKAAVKGERQRRKQAEVESRRAQRQRQRHEDETQDRSDRTTQQRNAMQNEPAGLERQMSDRMLVAAAAAQLLQQGGPLPQGAPGVDVSALEATIRSLEASGQKVTPELLANHLKQLQALVAARQMPPGTPTAPVTAQALEQRVAPEGYRHKPYCKGTCGGRCNFDAPEQPEPVYPAVPPEVKVISVQPDALFLEPQYVLRREDHKRLETFRFLAPAKTPAPPMPAPAGDVVGVAPRTAMWPSSRIIIEFRALLKSAEDCPTKLLFRYRLHGVGEVVTEPSGRAAKPELQTAAGAGIHILRQPHGGRDGVANTFELLAQHGDAAVPATGHESHRGGSTARVALPGGYMRYLQEDALYVDVINAETHFVWGTARVDLFPLSRRAHEPSAHHLGETVITDPLGEEVDRDPLDVTKPYLSSAPALKATLVYQLINEGTGELWGQPAAAAAAAAPRKQNRPTGKHRVVAKKIFDGELAALGLKDVNLPTHEAALKRPSAASPSPAGACGSIAADPSAGVPLGVGENGDGRGNLIYFKCEASDAPLRTGWALAETEDCNTHLQAAARAIDETAGSWGVCLLSDGHMKGRGYGCIITKSHQEPPRSFRLAIHKGPLDEVDRKMVNESSRECLRRARADFAKDRLLRENQEKVAAKEAPAAKPPPVAAQAHYHDLEERLETISRLRAKGRRREQLLKAQLQDALTHSITVDVSPGRAALVELNVKNPFGVGYVFTLDIHDNSAPDVDELGVVTQVDIWRALCTEYGVPPPQEHEVIRDGFGNIFGGNKVPVAGAGSSRVPLQFLSFADGLCGRAPILARTVVVYLRDTDGTPRGVYQIRLNPASQPHVHIHRDVRLYGAPNETLRRWLPVGIAAEDHAAPAARNPNAASRRRLMTVRTTSPCTLTSFIDWQTSRHGHIVPIETLQIEAAFPRLGDFPPPDSSDSHAAGGAQTFMVYFYAGAAMLPRVVWRLHLVPCTLIAGIQRYMGQSSELCIPLTTPCDEATRGKLRLGLGHGLLGESAGAGDWKVGLKEAHYTPQGFRFLVRPVDDVVRRVRANAVVAGGDGPPMLHEPYLLMVQGKARGQDPRTQPPVTQVPYENPPKVFRWTISHKNNTTAGQTYSAVYSPHGDFDVNPREVGLAAGQSQVFTITFTPSFPQTYHLNLWINDADDVTVSMHRRVFEVQAEYEHGVLTPCE